MSPGDSCRVCPHGKISQGILAPAPGYLIPGAPSSPLSNPHLIPLLRNLRLPPLLKSKIKTNGASRPFTTCLLSTSAACLPLSSHRESGLQMNSELHKHHALVFPSARVHSSIPPACRVLAVTPSPFSSSMKLSLMLLILPAQVTSFSLCFPKTLFISAAAAAK